MKISDFYVENVWYGGSLFSHGELLGSCLSVEGNKLYNCTGSLIDKDNEYVINKENFRTKEFHEEDIDILIAGCSVTFGMGIPEKNTWGHLVANNKKYVNLGIPGAGADLIFLTILNYIKRYGKPKQILCLFPDFFRMLFVSDPNFHIANNAENINVANTHIRTVSGDGSYIPPAKYLKAPITVEEAISPHESIYKSVVSIFYLQEFCRAASIDLIWSTWCMQADSILQNLFYNKSFFLDKKKYLSLSWNEFDHIDFTVRCTDSHQDYMSDSIYWNLGTDSGKHPGIHWHYHIAELFKSKINSSQL